MRLYTADEEHRIRLQASIRDWVRGGLLDAAQMPRLDDELRTGLKRTNNWLRAALGLFMAVIITAAVALVFVAFTIRGDTEIALTLAMAGVFCLALADYLVGALRLYRYGLEEVLAAFSVILTSSAAFVFVGGGHAALPHANAIAALVVGAAGSFGVYRRFGFIYAGIASMSCTALLPFQFDLSGSTERMCSAAVFAVVFGVARAGYRNVGDEFPGDDYATLEAAACVGTYLFLNLRALDLAWWLGIPGAPSVGRLFYWTTYLTTWLIPAAALLDALLARDRALLTAGLGLALVTFGTNKPYLSWPRQTWDPIVLGLLLVGCVVVVRRWLAAGEHGQRNGYTAAAILQSDHDMLRAIANVSVAWHGAVSRPPVETDASQFQQGRSGGAGGGADY